MRARPSRMTNSPGRVGEKHGLGVVSFLTTGRGTAVQKDLQEVQLVTPCSPVELLGQR